MSPVRIIKVLSSFSVVDYKVRAEPFTCSGSDRDQARVGTLSRVHTRMTQADEHTCQPLRSGFIKFVASRVETVTNRNRHEMVKLQCD